MESNRRIEVVFPDETLFRIKKPPGGFPGGLQVADQRSADPAT
jgi:hypothetical protein